MKASKVAGVRFPAPHMVDNKKSRVMTKTLKERQEAQFRQKLRALIGSVTHTQNIADQAMALAKDLMTEAEQEDSDALRVMENVSCVCEEALQALCEELKKGTRLYERPCKGEPEDDEITERILRDL